MRRSRWGGRGAPSHAGHREECVLHPKSNGKSLENLEQRSNIITDTFSCFVKTGLEGAWAESRGAVRMLPDGWEGHSSGSY